MASPQKENGFTGIANELIEAFCRVRLPDYERVIVLWIWRKTYGFGKKEDWISNSQFVKATGINKSNICRGLRNLKDKKIVVCRDNKWLSVNKDYSEWNVVCRDNKELSPTQLAVVSYATTKEIYTKENNTFRPKTASKSPNMLKERILDELGNPLEEESPKKELSVSNYKKFRKYFCERYQALYGVYPEESKGEYFSFIRARKKFSVRELKELVEFFLKDKDKATEHPTINACFSGVQISKWKLHEQKYQ